MLTATLLSAITIHEAKHYSISNLLCGIIAAFLSIPFKRALIVTVGGNRLGRRVIIAMELGHECSRAQHSGVAIPV